MQKDVFIYGYIGTGSGEVSIQAVKAQLSPDASEYVVHIVSGGGDVFEGYGIYNILKNTGKKITVHIEGLCASIATLIAGAGSKIIMNRTAEFMIHNPKISNLSGDARIIRSVAEQLDKIKTLLIDVYERRTGLSKEKLWELYDNETWLTAAEARKMGFVDEDVDAIKAVAKVDNTKMEMEQKQNTMFDALSKKISNIFKALRFTNQVTETLEDGRKVIVMAEGDEWEGVQVMLEDGTPLEPGEYKLAGGKTITVDENSTIKQVVIAEPPADGKQDTEKEKEEMENAKIKELEAKIAELEQQKAEAASQASQAEARAAKFENSVKSLEKEFGSLKEALKKTVGDSTPPAGGGSLNPAQPGVTNDPIANFYKNAIRR